MTTLRQPSNLGAAGKAAWQRALRALELADEPDQLYDAAARYAKAVHLADKAWRDWQKAGEPTVSENPNGAAGVHPLLKAIHDAEQNAKKYGEALGLTISARLASGTKHRGPKPTAQPGISRPPAEDRRERLRAV